MTVNTCILEPFLDWSPDAVDVPLKNGLRIQILPSMNELFRARKHQYAAFLAREGLLVVWDDDPALLFDRAKRIQDSLLEFVCQNPEEEDPESKLLLHGDDEEARIQIEERPIMYFDAFLVSCSLCLLIFLIGLGYAQIALEVAVLHTWPSLAYLVMTPIDFFLSLVNFPSPVNV
jgi:hypothetical protein